ncbi:MAG: DEAD/DEAH box helicase [Cyclobacteriaceae bacterium]
MSDNITFEDLKISPNLLKAVKELGYEQPTPIQQKAIPKVLAGQDVIGIAQTGTGKTAAFVSPIISKIKYAQGTDPRALILAPTKELAIQINEELLKLAQFTDLRCLVIYGGIGATEQLKKIEEGVDILVATPGRFWDLYSRGGIPVKQIKTIVLDEADKLMDMGFMPQLRQLQEVLPQKRQNLLFSATFSQRVESLSEEFLLYPTKIEVTPQATPVDKIRQSLYEVPNFKTKMNLLRHFVEDEEKFSRVLIFINSKKTAENIGRFMDRKINGEVRIIHSNKGQNTRINSINDFARGDVRFLVSTGISARGIDIQDISHVINFEVPTDHEDYVHRIGRTGRAGKEGFAITMANPVEMYHIKKIEKIIKQEIPVRRIPKEVTIEDTPKGERQEIARRLDYFKQKDDPTYKGAFHEKKKKFRPDEKKKNYKKGRR